MLRTEAMARERLVLVDGHSMVYRAYFAIPGHLSTKEGLPTNAIFGFTNMLRKLLAGRKPERVAVVFDAPGKTFRSEAYADYKANRTSMPDDLKTQLPWIDRVVTAHNFGIIRHPGVEADDVIGTLTERAVAAGMDVLIVSADKDFTQLIRSEPVEVRMFDGIREVTYDPDLAKKKYGVPPEQFVDLLAMIGDKLDNIPGVPGIGQKGAAALLEKYGTLEGILAHTDELKPGQRKKLEEHREQARLSQALATIDRDVAIEVTLDDLCFTPPDQEALNQLYLDLEFFSLLKNDAKRNAEAEEAGLSARLGDARDLAKLSTDQTYGVAVIAEPPLVTGELIGFAVAAAGGEALYVPFSPQDREALAAFFSDPKKRKVAHEHKLLWMLLHRQGIVLAGVVGDTQLASFLVEPTKLVPHRLEQLAKEYLQRTLRPLDDLTGRGKKAQPVSALAPAEVGTWLCHQADAVARLWPILFKKVEEMGLFEQLQEREMPLAPVLGAMELAGVMVDRAELEKAEQAFAEELSQIEARIFEIAGRRFNVGSPKQLSKVLFEELKLPVIKRTKTGYSTNAEVLERLAPKHEIARDLLQHRRLAKLINTYTSVLAAAINPVTGRVHTTIQQTAGATGRLITTDPDLQRTPIKTEEGARIRRCFVAPEGTRLISADWSQIELRVLAHFTEDPRLIEAFAKNLDVHRRTASRLFDVAEDAVTPKQRDVAKTINFATIYGQGATALAQILNVPRKEAQAYIDGYFEAYAGVRAWLDRTVEAARTDGWVTTLFGRRRFIPELFSNNPIDRMAGERIAVNTPIQGSAADICKLAMLHVAEALPAEAPGTRMLLQIHDELLLEAPESEVEPAAAVVRHYMEHAVALKVPLVVQVGTGHSWFEAH